MLRVLFSTVFDISVISGVFILIITFLRIVFKGSPKWTRYFLWMLVALRLICPVFIESRWSIIPEKQILVTHVLENTSAKLLEGRLTEKNYSIWEVLSLIWIIGIMVFWARLIIENIQISWKTQSAVRADRLNKDLTQKEMLYQDVYYLDGIRTSFARGILNPRIYIPSYICQGDIDSIIAHERVHIKRKDILWKQLGYIVASVHWFNPLVWFGYILFINDIELACDEKVIIKMNEESRKKYILALIHSTEKYNKLTFSTVAFGKIPIRRRLKAIMNFKKLSVGAAVVTLVAGIGAGAFFATRQVKGDEATKTESVKLEDGSVLITEKDFHSISKENWDKTNIWSILSEDEKKDIIKIESVDTGSGEDYIVTKIVVDD